MVSDPNDQSAGSFLDEQLEKLGAEAYVHLGDRFDDTIRYLTRFDGPDRDYAFIYTDDTSVLCAPTLFGEQARREFPGDLVYEASELSGDTGVERAIEVLDSFEVDGAIAIPETVTHRDYERFRAAGFEPVLTAAVEDARESKSGAELDRLATVHAATQAGLARGEAILASASIVDGAVHWEGQPLTTERLRREINQVLVANGVRDEGNTVIGSGPSCADLHVTDDREISAHETVLVDISPKGPDGYYSDICRTFVVGDPDEWVTDAYRTVLQAQRAALDVLSEGAGIVASEVHAAAVAVIEGAGYQAGYGLERGFYHGTGHGIGLSLHERPTLSADRPLVPGAVLTVEPGVYDPDVGGVRIEDVVVVTEDGYENLTRYPRSIQPEVDRDPAWFVDAGPD